MKLNIIVNLVGAILFGTLFLEYCYGSYVPSGWLVGFLLLAACMSRVSRVFREYEKN